ncbi:MAG: aminotransferase-like domain-containing protein [Acidiferrobacter sp.]
MADLNLLPKQGRLLIERVMDVISQRIAARALAPGEKLPSIRELAEFMGVSKSTVVEAYERLGGEGVIRSRPGSGFYVVGHSAPLSLTELGPRLDHVVDPLWVSRQSLEAKREVMKPGCGWLPSSWMPDTSLRRALRTIARADGHSLTGYETPLGHTALRQLLARRMGERGIQATIDQLLLADSGTQAIDLLCRFLIEPKDVVMVDDPCYFNFHALLRAHRANVVGVPYTPNGPDVELFAQALASHKPRLYITNSAIHNPTGATLSPVVAHRLLKLAEQHDLTIIEDDIYADFEYKTAPRLAAFDGLNRVIHIGSFSKTLSASIRCGYIAARVDWIEKLSDLKIATSFGGSRISAELIFTVLKGGSYRKHTEGLRTRLSGAMSEASARLKAIGMIPWIEPGAGMFLWCMLPAGVDATRVAQEALKEGVVLAPGNVFSLSQSANSFMRFNVSQSINPKLIRMLEVILRKAS